MDLTLAAVAAVMRLIDTAIGAEDFRLVVFRNMYRLPRLSLPHSLQPEFYFDAHTASRAYWYLNLIEWMCRRSARSSGQ
jgi:hypothetical protein